MDSTIALKEATPPADTGPESPLIDLSDVEPRSALSEEFESFARIERVRRFLSFCLAIDYELTYSTPDKLSQEDFYHFCNLGLYCFRSTGYSPPLIYWNSLIFLKPRDNLPVHDTRLDAELLQPAMALGVPCTAAISMLRFFVSSIRFWKAGYQSQVYSLALATSLNNVAAKIFLDRELLPHAVLPPLDAGFRKLFDERLAWQLDRWFRDTRGPCDYDVNSLGTWLQGREVESVGEGRMRYKMSQDSGLGYDCWALGLMMQALGPSTLGESWFVKAMRYWLEPRKGGFYEIEGGGLKWDDDASLV